MALDTLVAGAYTGTYNAVATGLTQKGYEFEQTFKTELIDETDIWGLTTIDAVYRGGDAFLQYESRTYKAGSTTPFAPWGAIGTISTTAAPIGRLASAVASATVLTAVANTPAAAAPATLTAALSLLAENFQGKLLFDSRLRNVPIRLRLYPSLNTGTLTWIALT